MEIAKKTQRIECVEFSLIKFQNEQFWQKLSFAYLVFVKKLNKKTSIS